MTQPDIDRLRELLANATPGDWLSTERGLLGNGVFAEGMDVKATGPLIACWSGGEIGADTAEANALLVASAKSALPTLLDTIEALIKERDDLKEALGRVALEDMHTRRVKPNSSGAIRGRGGMIAVYALTGKNGSFVGNDEIAALIGYERNPDVVQALSIGGEG